MNFGPATAGDKSTFSQSHCEGVFLCLDSQNPECVIT